MKKSSFAEKFQIFMGRLSQPDSTCPEIALSFSLGTLIAILPTPGFGIFVGLSLLLFFKSLNKIAMVLAISVWNPFLQIPVYFASYRLGSALMGQAATLQVDQSWIILLTEYTQAFVVGNGILGVVISTGSYFLILKITQIHRRKKAVSELLKAYQLVRIPTKSI